MCIINRAIERINIPTMIMIAFGYAALFSDDITAGPMLIISANKKSSEA